MTVPQIIGVALLCLVAGLAGRYVWDFTGPWRSRPQTCARCAELEEEVAKVRAVLFECSELLSQVTLALLDEMEGR